MAFSLNSSSYKKMENELARALKAGSDVRVSIDVNYTSDSIRPSRICVKAWINGEAKLFRFKQ